MMRYMIPAFMILSVIGLIAAAACMKLGDHMEIDAAYDLGYAGVCALLAIAAGVARP